MADRKIYTTMNHAQFKFLDRNRDVCPDLLLASIKEKNLLIDQPILVDKEFNVLDGQNRVRVAETLNVPISYYFAEKTTVDDIARCQVKRSWVLSDYLKYYSHLPNYIFINHIIEQYKIPLYCAVSCCSFGDSPYIKFRQGSFTLKSDVYTLESVIRMTMHVIDFLKELVITTQKKNVSFNNRLFRAIFYCCSEENYNHEHMLSALQSYQKRSLSLLTSNSQEIINQTLRNGIYNIKLDEKNKI